MNFDIDTIIGSIYALDQEIPEFEKVKNLLHIAGQDKTQVEAAMAEITANEGEPGDMHLAIKKMDRNAKQVLFSLLPMEHPVYDLLWLMLEDVELRSLARESLVAGSDWLALLETRLEAIETKPAMLAEVLRDLEDVQTIRELEVKLDEYYLKVLARSTKSVGAIKSYLEKEQSWWAEYLETRAAGEKGLEAMQQQHTREQMMAANSYLLTENTVGQVVRYVMRLKQLIYNLKLVWIATLGSSAVSVDELINYDALS